MGADLHLHTNNSDGIDTSNQLHSKVEKDASIDVISVTDHHVCTNMTIRDEKGVITVPGVEISAELGEMGCHLLGYTTAFHQKSQLIPIFTAINKGYIIRANLIYLRLKELGYVLPSFEEIKSRSHSGVIYLNDLADLLKDQLSLANVQEVKKWASLNGNLLFTKESKYLPKVETIAKIFYQENIQFVWAHPAKKFPFSVKQNSTKLKKYLDEFVLLGMKGIEVFHPSHSQEQVDFLLGYAKKHGLLITGGSDYHGKGRGTDRPISMLDKKYTKSFLNAIGYV